jgi:hypothetical protein
MVQNVQPLRSVQPPRRAAPFNPDSAVEREVMSKEQTFRSEDNAFCL